MEELEAKDQILFQYAGRDGDVTDHANPNEFLKNIASICNPARNVAGMMPHPERAGGLNEDDGRLIFSLIAA